MLNYYQFNPWVLQWNLNQKHNSLSRKCAWKCLQIGIHFVQASNVLYAFSCLLWGCILTTWLIFFNIKTIFPGIGIPIINRAWSPDHHQDHLIFIIKIPYHKITSLYWERPIRPFRQVKGRCKMWSTHLCVFLTHCHPVTPYDDIYLYQHWLRLWLGAWQRQANTWTNVAFSFGEVLWHSPKSNLTLMMTLAM